jgi:hypothetical protein
MRVRSLGMFVRELAMFPCGRRVVLGLFVLATRVVMLCLMMVMRRSVVVASRTVMMLAGRMLCHFAVLPRIGLGRWFRSVDIPSSAIPRKTRDGG